MKMRSYGVARAIYTVLAFFCWLQIILGTVIVVLGMIVVGGSALQGFGLPGVTAIFSTISGVFMVVTGVLGVASIQSGRTNVDVAEYTQQLLKIARDQIEISQQTLTQGQTAAQSFKVLAAQLSGRTSAGNGYDRVDWSAVNMGSEDGEERPTAPAGDRDDPSHQPAFSRDAPDGSLGIRNDPPAPFPGRVRDPGKAPPKPRSFAPREDGVLGGVTRDG